MCGIVAISHFDKWGISWKDREVFNQLLMVGSLRGMHGTGTFIVRDDGAMRSLKIGGGVFGLLHSKSYPEHIDPKPPVPYNADYPRDILLVGHNRFKTTGDATTEHAHPHRRGDIILVHNGTIPVYSNLPDFKKFDVDSDALANAINTLGIEDTIASTHGAYAIIYFNLKDLTLNVIRNDSRPLSMAIDHKDKRVFWASEAKMLEWILDRNDLRGFTIEEVTKDTLYTYKLDDYQPVKKELKGPKITEHYRGSISWWEENEIHLARSCQALEKARVIPIEEKQKRIKGAVKKLGKIGINVKILQDLKGLKKDSPLVFRVNDYADENPNEETFIVMGESKTLPGTSIRFRLKGEKLLKEVFETPEIIATVANLLEYPQGNEENDNFVVWVKNPKVYIAKSTSLALVAH